MTAAAMVLDGSPRGLAPVAPQVLDETALTGRSEPSFLPSVQASEPTLGNGVDVHGSHGELEDPPGYAQIIAPRAERQLLSVAQVERAGVDPEQGVIHIEER